MCRKVEYQKRVIYEGSKINRIKCAIKIQSAWRGYIVRKWYTNLRKSVPPKDPLLRRNFFQAKAGLAMISFSDYQLNNYFLQNYPLLI